MTEKNMKQIWVGPTLHKTIKLEAVKIGMTMSQLLANLIKKHREENK